MTKDKVRSKKQSKRKQQVKRQIAAIVAVTVIGASAVGIYNFKASAGLAETKGAVQSAQTDENELHQAGKDAAEETPKERLERVRTRATEKNYPQGVIELLDKNEETVGFVEDYEEKKDAASAEDIGVKPRDGEIPKLIQWDERWGYAPYGTSIVAVSGCGPTCLSMVICGLTGDTAATPAKVAAYGTKKGYVDEENNTYWNLMSEGCKDWGLSCYEGSVDEKQIVAELKNGHPIICSVGPGDFTDKGHFIVLTGYEDGKIRVNDPFSEANSDKLWEFSRLEEQIKALWVYSLSEK